jgi:predicted membrane chloride channel (bestrophin family)
LGQPLCGINDVQCTGKWYSLSIMTSWVLQQFMIWLIYIIRGSWWRKMVETYSNIIIRSLFYLALWYNWPTHIKQKNWFRNYTNSPIASSFFNVISTHLFVILLTVFIVLGAKCQANTFDGERCLYGALNNRIRNLLRTYNVVSSKTLRRDQYEEFLRRSEHNIYYVELYPLVYTSYLPWSVWPSLAIIIF